MYISQMKPTLPRPVDSSVTPAELNGSVMLENTDAGTNGKAVGTRRDIQDEAEGSRILQGDAIEGERQRVGAWTDDDES